jgi:heme o synthase
MMGLTMTPAKLSRNQIQIFRYLLIGTSIAVFALIVIGSLLRVTQAGGACMDWPTCFGGWYPPTSNGLIANDVLFDYLHRLLTIFVATLILLSAIVARRFFASERWIVGPLFGAGFIVFAQILLGGTIVFQDPGSIRATYSAVHLGLSLSILACLLLATVVAFYINRPSGKGHHMVFRSPFARLSLLTLGTVFILLVSGAIVANTGATEACSGWPACNGTFLPQDTSGWINFSHRFIVLMASGLMGLLFIRGWQTQRTQTPILVATTAGFIVFLAQALLGSKLVAGYPTYLLGLHGVTAVAVWGILVLQVVTVGLAGRTGEDEELEANSFRERKGLLKDLLMLTKPIVVVLLLVTTYAGMVIGGRAWPTLSLTFWVLVGGFLAAGGSGAINQYIDRFDDTKMQRTQKRPIPAGRLTPGEGLAFGVAAALTSFYIMVAFVNLLAALLTLAGIIYYVLIYSIILKKTTVQNIVIGGGAGAIPPLVGWAAVTGSLNIPSLFLFAVVFMWTPPHFWALALVRRVDYARAGVPMMPVVRGEKETRWQIFIYTVELVVLTLILPLFGLGGSIYLIGAVILGLWLLLAAWRVWKKGGNKLAWKMYRYSSMYLAFLFAILMVDALL